MTNKYLNEELLKFQPALSDEFRRSTDWDEGICTSAHITYGQLLVHYIIEVIENNDTDEAKRIFEFINKLFELNSDFVDDILIMSVLLYFKLYIDISVYFAPHHKKTWKAWEDILKSPY